MRIKIVGSLGDELGVTAAVREAALQHPDEMIRLFGRWNPDIWVNNPWLNIGNLEDGRLIECYSYKPQTRETQNSRTQHNMKLLGLDMSRIRDEFPDFCFQDEELAAPIRVFATRSPEETQWTPLDVVMQPDHERVIAVDPGARWISRVWPEERFSELCERLSARGFTVVQVGSQGARPLRGIRENLVDRLRLRDLARFLGRVTLYVGNDSGLFHVAAAVGTPQVTIYGVSRYAAGPYSTTVAVVPPTECSASCYKKCARRLSPKDANVSFCMEEISVDQVLAAVDQALARPRPPSRLVPTISRAQAWELRHAGGTP